YAHSLALEVGHAANAVGLLRAAGQREQGEPPGGGEPGNVGTMGKGIERGVKGGGGVVHTAGIECLQGRAAASGVNQLDIQSLIGEKSGCAGGLVGCNAQQLAAKGQFDGFFRGGEAVAWYAGN